MSDEQDKPNLKVVGEIQNINIAKMRKNLNEMKEAMDMLIEFHQIDAKLKYSRYEALIGEGFKPEQALEIIIGTLP